MQVAYYPKKFHNKKTTLILGAFKYIHNGHMELIKKAQEFKKPIHMVIFKHDKEIISIESRLQILSNLEIDFVTVIDFTKEFMNLDGMEWLGKIKEISNAQNIVVGKDFYFGKGKKFSVKDIEGANVINILKVNNKKISTSLICEMIQLGDVKEIENLSPFPLMFRTFVNAKKELVKDYIKDLHSGIYAIYVIQNDVKYYGLLHVSMKGKQTIQVPDLRIVNKHFEPDIYIVKTVRKIISDTFDKINDKDMQGVVDYLNIYHNF